MNCILVGSNLKVEKIAEITVERQTVLRPFFSYISEQTPELSSVIVGDYYDPTTGTFSSSLKRKALTKYEFRKLFTMDELVKMDNLSSFVQLTPIQAAQYNTLVKNFEAASEIDLDNPDVIYGLGLLSQFGVLTPERRDAILGV